VLLFLELLRRSHFKTHFWRKTNRDH